MNKFSMKILLILGTLGMVQTALAADKKFPDLINITFYGFESIPHNVLERAINAVPPQETTWGCGLHQCGHAFECAYMAAKCQNQLAINYKIAGEYPLAIDVNARKLKYESILKMCGAILDEHGVFRSGAAPAELTNFINDRLPKDFAYKAVAQSTATLEMSQLLDEVKKGIAIKMPVLAYYTPNPSSSSSILHVYSIVGYRDDGEHTELMLLDTKRNGADRLEKMKASVFLHHMNTQTSINLVQGINTLAGTALRPQIEAIGGRVIASQYLTEWQAFSLVTFVDKSPVPPKETEPKEAEAKETEPEEAKSEETEPVTCNQQ